MTPEQRTKASIDLTSTYIYNYYSDWRLAKVLTLKKLLEERYEFYKDLILEVKSQHDKTGEATIAHEIKNGLYFDAISQCVQYVEDLFALINAGKKQDFFIKNIITYDAGKVNNLIKSFNTNISTKTIAEAFHFQHNLPFSTDIDKKNFESHVQTLMSLVRDVAKFHKSYHHFHNQYKHGLAVALRPFGNVYTQKQVNEDKKGGLKPYITVYDNWSLQTAAKRGTYKNNDAILMTGFTENVRPFIGELIKENNFIRLVHPEDTDFNIDLLVDIAYKARACINTFISNYYFKVNSDKQETKFQLPHNYRTNKVIQIIYRKEV